MIAADETFDGTWPYPASYNEAAGFRQHYVDEGPERPDQTIVMLHGEPTWGYEWRHLIGPLGALVDIMLTEAGSLVETGGIRPRAVERLVSGNHGISRLPVRCCPY